MRQHVRTVLAPRLAVRRIGRAVAVALAPIVIALAVPGGAWAAPPGAPVVGGQSGALSGGLALTDFQRGYATWAYGAVGGVAIRRLARSDSARVARLHTVTEDGLPEVYELLGRAVDANGTPWVQVIIPMRPTGRSGWVPAKDLGAFHLVHSLLVINRPTRELTLLRGGVVVFRARVGVGKPSTPTPAGHFWIREKFPVSGVPLYGPYAIGTSNYSAVETDWPGGGVVGIHGTDQPNLIPGAPSHGCIRLRNSQITRLYNQITVGTPLIII
jgi:hypothetical protein